MDAQQKQMVITRRPHVAVVADITQPILGLDTPETLAEDMQQSPWWAIETAHDLDALLQGKAAFKQQLQAAIAKAQGIVKALDAREENLLRVHGHVVPAPEDGKTRRMTKIVGGGSFCHQPERSAPLKLVDRQAALGAGFAKLAEPEIVLNTAAVRKALATGKPPAALVVYGVEVGTAPPAVSYTAPGATEIAQP